MAHFTNCEDIRGVPDLNSPFDSWKFWLSSAAMFAGILIVGLIPGCAKGAEVQHEMQSPARLERSLSESVTPGADPAP
jgi:hypothetical protein